MEIAMKESDKKRPSIGFDPDDYAEIERAAKSEGHKVVPWMRAELIKLARAVNNRNA